MKSSAFTEVSEAALAMDMPGRGTWEDFYTTEGTNTRLSISQNKIDEFYFPAMGFSLVAGRTFEEGRGEDQSGLIINETTARLFQWTNEEAIGQKIIYPDYPGDLKVIGVVEDYHLQSLRQEIMPMMFFHMDADVWGDQRVVAVKYRGENEDQLLSKLEQSWNRMTDDVPFDYSFYTDEIAQLYAQERSLSGLFSIFTGFSLFIAIIGLIGLLSFATEQRKKGDRHPKSARSLQTANFQPPEQTVYGIIPPGLDFGDPSFLAANAKLAECLCIQSGCIGICLPISRHYRYHPIPGECQLFVFAHSCYESGRSTER
jgi:hypothetical protein